MKDFLMQFSDVFFYIIAVIIIYTIFKFLFLLIRYFIFKKFINSLLNKLYEEDEGDTSFADSKTNKEDERKKDLELEKQQELEQKVEILNNKEKGIDPEERIIGIAKKIYGPWTAKIVKEFMQKIIKLNPEDLKKGYFQATVLAEKKYRESIRNQRGR